MPSHLLTSSSSSPLILLCQTLNSNSVSKLRKGGGIIGTEREILGQLQFAATEKTDLEAQTMVLPLFPLPPPIRKARA